MMMEDKNNETTSLEEVIDNHQTQMVGIDAYSEEYVQLTKDLSALYKIQNDNQSSLLKERDFKLKERDLKLKEEELQIKREREKKEDFFRQKDFDLKGEELLLKIKEMDRKGKVSPDTLVMVTGNLVGIALILNFEQLGVITSKAMGLLIKLR